MHVNTKTDEIRLHVAEARQLRKAIVVAQKVERYAFAAGRDTIADAAKSAAEYLDHLLRAVPCVPEKPRQAAKAEEAK